MNEQIHHHLVAIPNNNNNNKGCSGTATNSCSRADMVSTPDYAEAVMREFRQLVVGLQEEQHELREKLEAQQPSSSDISTTSRPPSYKTVLKQIHQHHDTSTYQSSSSNTNHNNSIPEPPKRTKRKSATLSTVTTRPSSSHQAHNTLQHHHLRSNINAAMASATSAIVGRGAFIVLEGLDRVGKSTLAKNLVEHLKKIKKPVTYVRFPDRTTPVGHLIDDFLKNSSSRHIDDHVIHLLFSANRWELAKSIRNAIQGGTTVVADRYSYSGLVYSSAKKDLNLGWCRGMERGLPRPDLVIYLELPSEAQSQRPGFGDERFETRDMQDQVRIQYEKVMEMSKETWLRIDVEHKSPDQVLGEVIMPVKRCLDSAKLSEFGSLDFF